VHHCTKTTHRRLRRVRYGATSCRLSDEHRRMRAIGSRLSGEKGHSMQSQAFSNVQIHTILIPHRHTRHLISYNAFKLPVPAKSTIQPTPAQSENPHHATNNRKILTPPHRNRRFFFVSRSPSHAADVVK
jgi:hypothetical protein